MNKITKFFGLQKFEKQEDGTLIVEGIASSPEIDSDGEIITADAMNKAIPDFMRWANIREMHGSSAAGVALECRVLEDGRTYLKCLVVDKEAIRKVLLGVYKGFSIGGKVLQKIGDTIVELLLSEISLVDRPANPGASFFARDKFLMHKAFNSEEVDNKDNLDNINNMDDNNNNKTEAEVKPVEVQEQGQASTTTEQNPSNETEEQQASREAAEQASKIDDAVKFLKSVNYKFEEHETLQKSFKESSDELVKSQDINKALQLEIQKFKTENDTLTKRVTELENIPMPQKSILGAVDKRNDSPDVDSETEIQLVENNGKIDLQASLMKTMLVANGFGKSRE